jgi:LemA protein
VAQVVPRPEAIRRHRRRRWISLRRFRAALIGTLSAVSLWVLGHIYYYNQLVALEQNVDRAWAQVEAQQARRSHVSRSTRQFVEFYAHHEREILTELTELRAIKKRSGKQPPDVVEADKALRPPAAIDGVPAFDASSPFAGPSGSRIGLEGLQLVAEQYPQLMLAQNLQQWQASTVATEIEIATRVIDYNNAVNAYTTVLSQFPARIFASVLGFKPAKFYSPAKDETIYHDPSL